MKFAFYGDSHTLGGETEDHIILNKSFKEVNDGKINGYISISLYPSKNDFVKYEYKSLAPNWKLYENLKSKKFLRTNLLPLTKNS